jgi:hypothetical protein
VELFDEKIIKEYIQFKNANPDNFSWWSYVNFKTDINMALSFAKFFYPEVIEIDGCFLLKDNFDENRYNQWKDTLGNDIRGIEGAMNSYEVVDFFHINTDYEDENIDEQIEALGTVLKTFWQLSFKERFPDKDIKVELIDDGDDFYITVYSK